MIASDVVAAVAVTLFATDLLRPGVPRETLFLVSVLAALPRFVAEGIERPRSLLATRGTLVRARALAIMGVILALTATRYAILSIPSAGSRSEFETVLVIACWAAGFALRDPGTYRIYEPLCAVTLVAGLLNDCSGPLVLVPIAFLALAFSAALRHQLGRAAISRRVRRVSVRNSAVAALLIAALVAGVFAAGRAALRTIVVPRASPPGSADEIPDNPDYDASTDPGAAGEPGGTPDWSLKPHGAGRAGALGLGPRNVVDGGPGDIVQRVMPAPEGHGAQPERSEPPGADTLWRARTYVRFDPEREEWIDQGLTFWTRPPMRGSTLLRNPPALGRDPVAWLVDVVGENVDTLLVPYFTSEVRFEARRGGDVDLRANADGDVCAEGGDFQSGRRHRILLRPFDAVHPPIGDAPIGLSPSDDYLEIPRGTTKLGAHVRDVAARTLDRDAGILAKIRGLESFFKNTYRYSLSPRMGPLPKNLTDFMLRRRAGDCRHLASAAALVFRASGVPTRLVEGLTGVEPAEDGRGFLVRRSCAHVWIEVHARSGWIPVDPTRWVAPRLGRDLASPKEAGAASNLRDKIGGPDERKAAAPPPKRFNPIDNPAILIAVTSLAGLVVILMIARSWRRAPERKPDEEEEKDPGVAIAEVSASDPRAFTPRTPADHLLLDYANMQDDLSLSGMERQPHETPREHARRVASGPGEPSAPAFGSLVPLVDDGLYGHADLTDADLATGRVAIQAIKKVLR